MGLKTKNGLLVSIVGFGLTLAAGCWTKSPHDESLFTIPKSPTIGSITSREEVLKGWMAVHDHQWNAARKHFQRAIQLDPHPSVQQLPSMVEKATLEQQRGAQK